MPWLKLNAGCIVLDVNVEDCDATARIHLKIRGNGINIDQNNLAVPKEEVVFLAKSLKKCLTQDNYHWQHGDSVSGRYGIFLESEEGDKYSEFIYYLEAHSASRIVIDFNEENMRCLLEYLEMVRLTLTMILPNRCTPAALCINVFMLFKPPSFSYIVCSMLVFSLLFTILLHPSSYAVCSDR